MLYSSSSSSSSERQDQNQASSCSGAGTGPGATKTKPINDICCSDAHLEPVRMGQHSDHTSTYTRQISQDSGNASDCRDSDVLQPETVAASWNQPLTTQTIQQHDTLGALPCDNQETPTSDPGEPTNRDPAQKRPASSHSSHTTSIDQQRLAPEYSHQGASQKRWASSRPNCSTQSFPESPECCLAVKPTETSCCPVQAQPSVSGRQGRDDGSGGDLPEDETREPEEPEEPLDYKPILAKILNEKKLALISTPGVITFLGSGRAASGAPSSAYRRTRM